MTVVSLSVLNDGLLGVVAPIGMAAAKGTCLVVDFVNCAERDGLSLASLIQEGPQRSHLEPQRRGVSFLHNGGASAEAAAEILDALCETWPNVVFSVPVGSRWFEKVPAVRLEAILQGPFVPPAGAGAVLQPVGVGGPPEGHSGPVLAHLRSRMVRSMLSGSVDPRSRWVRSWQPVWGSL